MSGLTESDSGVLCRLIASSCQGLLRLASLEKLQVRSIRLSCVVHTNDLVIGCFGGPLMLLPDGYGACHSLVTGLLLVVTQTVNLNFGILDSIDCPFDVALSMCWITGKREAHPGEQFASPSACLFAVLPTLNSRMRRGACK